MTDNTDEPTSTWGGNDEAETRIAGASPAGHAAKPQGETQRFENDATHAAPRETSQPAQGDAGVDGAEAPTQASYAPNAGQPAAGQSAGASSQAYPSAPVSSQQAAPYSQGYPGNGGQYGTSVAPGGAAGQYDAQPGQHGSAPQGAYGQQNGAYSAYGSAAPQGNQYGSGSQGGFGQPGGAAGSHAPQGGQYGSVPQPPQYGSAAPQGSQYGSAPQGHQYGSAAQGSQYGSAAPQGNQYGSAPQAPQYGSAPQGGHGQQQYSGAGHNTPTSQQGQYNSAAYGQPHAQSTTKTAATGVSPIAKFGPFLPALLGLIAPFVTWVTFKSGSERVALNGIGGNSNASNPTLGQSSNTGGIFVLILVIGLVVAGVLAVLGKLNAKVAGIITAAIGAVMLILGIAQFINASSLVSANGDAAGYKATMGAGVWLTILAGLAALAAGIVAFLQSRKGAAASSTPGAGNQWNGGFNAGGQQQFGANQNQSFGQNNQGFGSHH